MTCKQKQQQRQAVPRTTRQQLAIREQYLLSELAKIGWRVTPTGPFALYLQKAA